MPVNSHHEAGANLLLSLAASGSKARPRDEGLPATDEGAVSPPMESKDSHKEESTIDKSPARQVSEGSLAASPWGYAAAPPPGAVFYAPFPGFYPMMHMPSQAIQSKTKDFSPKAGDGDDEDDGDKRVISPTPSEKEEKASATPPTFLPYHWPYAYGYYPYPYPATPADANKAAESASKRKEPSTEVVASTAAAPPPVKKRKSTPTIGTSVAETDKSTSPLKIVTTPKEEDASSPNTSLRSVPLADPPTRCTQCDDDSPPPAFLDVINYPPTVETTTENGKKQCVMCGYSRRVSGSKVVASKSDDDEKCVIPKQNKGVCTHCDVTVWTLSATNREIKWCKGCKNFRYWTAFGHKGAATKCGKCRDRQKSKYAAQKRSLQEAEYDVALQLRQLKEQK